MLPKTELRAALRQARLTLPETEVAERSTRIASRLETLIGKRKYRSAHCYEPIAGLHEVDVRPLMTWFAAQQAAIYTSRNIGGSWQIVAVSGHTPKQPVHFDCIIVPMLGFDRRLHRLGQGGGYYDRLLSDQPKAFKIGVCFELGKLPEVPIEAHDVALDTIVTEAAIYLA